MKTNSLLMIGLLTLFTLASAHAAKKITLDVQCTPLKRAGGASTMINGKISLKQQANGSYLGIGRLSVNVSRAMIEHAVILAEDDIPVLAYFDDIVTPTLQAMPQEGVESKIARFILVQKNPDDAKLFSQIETKDNETYQTECDLKY